MDFGCKPLYAVEGLVFDVHEAQYIRRTVMRTWKVMALCAVGVACSGDGENPGDDTDVVDEQCPEVAHFLDVSKAVGPGEGYPAPELAASCDGDTLIVESNGIPHYSFVPMTPNGLEVFEWRFEVTRTPQIADTDTDIPLLGYVGFAVNGIPIYGPNEGPVPDPFGDPIHNGIMDGCMGHVGNAYHNHALFVKCLTESSLVAMPWTNDDPPSDEVSPIVGYAADGFPIYGPYGCTDEACDEVIQFKSSWVQTGDPTTYAWENHEYQEQSGAEYLDRCNGRIGPDGTYRYHATESFPYLLGCYKGTPRDAGGDGNQGGGDGNGGGQDGPPSCETDSDCVDGCPPGSMDCVCHETPNMDKICVPACETDADCPMVQTGQLTCDEAQGICIPG